MDVPMKGFTVFIIGKLGKTKPVMTRQIEDLGGRVVSKVTDNTTICISNDSEWVVNVKPWVSMKQLVATLKDVSY